MTLRLNRHFALVASLSVIFSHLPSPAEAPNETKGRRHGFARAGNRYPPRIASGASFFGIML
jgi:hypothetical protein